jgi:rubredoxin
MKCPKCGYVRVATDVAPEWQCPSCHVAYIKAKASSDEPGAAAPAPSPPKVLKPAPAPAAIDDPDELAALAASGQKIVIYSILLNFVVRAMLQGNVVAPLVAMVMAFAVAAYSLVGVLRICSALEKSQNQKLTFMALSCMPWLNLIALVILNAKATALLRAAGWRVGLLGARP